jgi:Cu(I)/Ag(I) efflux system membrane fusion protein
MQKSLYRGLLLVLFLGAFWAGAWTNQPQTGRNEPVQEGRRILYYVDPMNPAHTSDQPGLAPCGMQMEPVYADSDDAAGGQAPGAMPPGTIRITPAKQQLIGVRVEPARMTAQRQALRTLGRIAPDENRTHRLTTGDNGWVWDVSEATTGSVVNQDQLLASLYYDRFLTRQEDYLRALEYEQRKGQYASQRSTPEQADPETSSFAKVATTFGGLSSAGRVFYNLRDQLEVAKLELYSLGVGELQMQEITQSKRISSNVDVLSPVKGIVLSRNISPQQRFNKGAELFRIADLSRVWVLADVFEREARYIRPGMRAQVTLPHQDEVFEATVTDVRPVFDGVTRTLKVRLETDNPAYVLLPEMFVDVAFELAFPPAVVVPADAVLDSGLKKTVFVELGNGVFEPRTVETGWRMGDRVEIVTGLTSGERIVVAGNFFIDSESRMKPALAGHPHPEAEKPGPDAGRDLVVSAGQGQGYAFHGETPGAGMPAVIPLVRKALAAQKFPQDPVCRMGVEEQAAAAAGLTSDYRGQTYYFCSDYCKKRFDQGAHLFVKEPLEAPGQPVAANQGQPIAHSHGGQTHD